MSAKRALLGVITIISLLAFVFLMPALAAEQKPVTLRIAYIYAPESAVGQAAARYSRLVEERTNGKVKIQLFPSGQLGSEIQNREALQTGTLDMCSIGVPSLLCHGG